MKLPRCPNHLSCYLQTLSNVLIQAKLYAYNVGMITLGVSGLLLCYTLNSARLVSTLNSGKNGRWQRPKRSHAELS